MTIRICAVLLFLLWSFLGSETSFAQAPFEQIDAQSKLVPDSLITYQSITNYLTKDLKTETEKLRAIYVWVTHNIRYDFDDKTPAINSNQVVKKKSGYVGITANL